MNIYVISANSYHLVDLEIKKIIKDQVPLVFNLNSCSIDDLLEEASYFDLTGEPKYLIASNADFLSSSKLSDKDENKLLSYLKNPNLNTIIIFTTYAPIDNRRKIVKFIKDQYKVINIPSWDKLKMKEEARNYLINKGYKIDNDSINYIVNNVYNNIDILYNELDKIILYYTNKNKIIYFKDIESIIGKEIDSNNYHFINAVIEKNLEEALRIWKNLKVYKVDSLTLINLLAREYRLMYNIKVLEKKNISLNELAHNLSLQDWQIKKLYNNSLKYRREELLKNLYLLANMDLKIKKGDNDKDIILYPFLLEVCV